VRAWELWFQAPLPESEWREVTWQVMIAMRVAELYAQGNGPSAENMDPDDVSDLLDYQDAARPEREAVAQDQAAWAALQERGNTDG